MYRYDDIATTSYRTIYANNTLPTTLFQANNYTLSGVPTTLVDSAQGQYAALTTLLQGNAFTDPYGVVYPSPTPVM